MYYHFDASWFMFAHFVDPFFLCNGYFLVMSDYGMKEK